MIYFYTEMTNNASLRTSINAIDTWTQKAYTKNMKIYLGSDHRGFDLKEEIFAYLAKHNYDVEDVGDKVLDPEDDFPEFAQKACTRIIGSEDKDPRAILICGGGQGMAMAANRFRGIRASVIWDAYEAKMTRNDNDSNVLCLTAHVFEKSPKSWQGVIETWLNTPFASAPRYVRRNNQLDEF
jgi:ribose 5-phosphate isomerase B